MANARGNGKKNPVTVKGPWIAMPLDFLRSRAWSELSPHAAKMLLDLCSGLGPNARGNGDLSAAPAIMKPKGWNSNATRVAALQELEDARLISITRRGNRRACTLYAVTLWPMNCDFKKIDHGPGSFTTSDWEQVNADRAKQPTNDMPAKWNALRANTIALPSTGQPVAYMNPPRDNLPISPLSYAPVAGTKDHFSTPQVIPPRDTYLDTPSAGAVGGADVAGIAVGLAGIASAGVLREQLAMPAR